MTAQELTQKIADAGIGLISAFAKSAIQTCEYDVFLKQIHEQLTIHDPESTRRKLGDEISDELLRFFHS